MGGASMELEHAIGQNGDVSGGLHMHPSGVYIGVAGGTVVVNDFSDPHAQSFLRGHDDDISCLAVSPSGDMIATGQMGENSDVIVWDFASKSEKYRFQEHDYGIQCLAFSDDERLLVTIGIEADRKLFVWDLMTGYIVATITAAPLPTACVAWGGMVKDRKRRPTKNYQLATAGSGEVVMWELDPFTGTMEGERLHSGSLKRGHTALQFSADGNWLYTGSASGDFACYNVIHKEASRAIPVCSGGVHSLALSPHGGLLVGGGDGTVTLYVGSGRELEDAAQVSLPGAIKSLSYNASGTEILAGSAAGFVFRLRASDLSEVLVCEAHSAGVTAVAYPPDSSEQFATCSRDCTLRVWDAADYSVLAKAFVRDAGSPTCLAYSMDTLISGWEDGKVRCHRADNGELLYEIENVHRGGVTALQLSRNQRFIVTGGTEGDVRVWELRSRELVSHLKEHTMRVTQLALFDDDMHVLSCSRDRSFLLWDLRKEKRISNHTQRMGGINCIVLSRDQTRVLSVGQEKKITYWDLRTPDPIKLISPAHRDEATCIALSRNGRLLATGGTDQVIKLWDYDSGELIQSSGAHSGLVHALYFSPDDRQLVSVSEDGTVFVWNVYS
eukprot:PLAT8282.1.p1 GENE.PLAT8282.1~~PLAT8282.1.p1  ORF type:complete len:625 (-),score=294.66 PLAT8282.1:68-1903(-)